MNRTSRRRETAPGSGRSGQIVRREAREQIRARERSGVKDRIAGSARSGQNAAKDRTAESVRIRRTEGTDRTAEIEITEREEMPGPEITVRVRQSRSSNTQINGQGGGMKESFFYRPPLSCRMPKRFITENL